MTRVLIFAAALIVGAGGAKASDWKPCATGFKPENTTFQKPPPAWAIKKMKKECVLPIVSSTTGKTTGECVTPDLNDGVWQHAWCDYSAHKILWCLPSDEISPVCDEAFKTNVAGKAFHIFLCWPRSEATVSAAARRGRS